jgi:hypothetical protein
MAQPAWRARLLAALLLLAPGVDALGVIRDTPFRQAAALKFDLAPELQGVAYNKLAVTRDEVIYVLTERGVARAFDERLGLDRTYRALAEQ